MPMFRAMRDELSKYRRRKRRPMDGSVPGAPYVGYRRSRRYVSGLPYVPRRPSHHHNLYNWGVPREYHPNLNAPAAQSEEYWPNENWESHMLPHSTDPKLFRPFPDLPPEEKNITYEKSKTKSEFFLKLMEAMCRPFQEGQEIPSLADIWREHFRGDELDMSDLYAPSSEMPTDTAEESTPEDLARRFTGSSEQYSWGCLSNGSRGISSSLKISYWHKIDGEFDLSGRLVDAYLLDTLSQGNELFLWQTLTEYEFKTG